MKNVYIGKHASQLTNMAKFMECKWLNCPDWGLIQRPIPPLGVNHPSPNSEDVGDIDNDDNDDNNDDAGNDDLDN